MRRFEILEEARELQNLPHLPQDSPELRQMSSLFDSQLNPLGQEDTEGNGVDVFVAAAGSPSHPHPRAGSMDSPQLGDGSHIRRLSSDYHGSKSKKYQSRHGPDGALALSGDNDTTFPLPRPGASGRSLSAFNVTRKHRESMSSLGGA